MNKVKIETLNLKIGSKELTLTLSEAEKLRNTLNDLFGKEIVVKEVIRQIGVPTPVVYPQVGWYYNPKPYYNFPTITWDERDNGTSRDGSLDITC